MLRKVPEITIYFWIIKLLTTAMGESTSDYVVYKYNPYLAVLAGGFVLLIALVIQLKMKKYIPWIYWLTVTMVAVFGTMAADALHIQLRVPYIVSTIFFAIVLAIIFKVWHKTENTLSIHSIYTTRRELFYWAAILATFALGTAAGDLTAYTLGLGYFTSGLLFAFLFAIPAIGFWLFDLNDILAFWVCYILTRPLGASFADWTGKSKAVGGLGWGDAKVATVLTILIVLFVIYLTISKRDVET
jgi:uncharacterized membrane-anchored protein